MYDDNEICETDLRKKAIDAATDYYRVNHKNNVSKFKAGEIIPYAGRVFDESEVACLIDASLDFSLTSGQYTSEFEKKLGAFLGVEYCSFVNSGSSANLLAFMALTSPKLGDRRIRRGDEVITLAAGFPTTVAPIVQFGAVPVFADISLPTYNIDCSLLDEALSDKTKAVMLAHTMGNPFDLQKVADFCHKHNLWMIEDNCDALGAGYFYKSEWRYTGTIGHIGTSSFYPQRHITTGEGGAVYTKDFQLKRLVESFRDCGRDCWCPSGHDETCGKRFTQQFGKLPFGYDHKSVYSHFGYNLKATEMQAAIGCAQLDKLPEFIRKRRKNWELLKKGLSELSDFFILPEPQPDSIPSWFGFLLTVREDAGFSRDEIVGCLEAKNIQTRMLFAGNFLKHPCFDEIREAGNGYRVVGSLQNTELAMNYAFWIGVYPGITEDAINYIIECIKGYTRGKR